MCFNACLTKKKKFGCVIIELKYQKDRIIRKMHETIIVKKLRLWINFLIAALRSRNNAVGIGLIKLKAAVAMLACKPCIGNLRANTKMFKIMKIQEEALVIEYGKNWKGKEIWRINFQYGQKKYSSC